MLAPTHNRALEACLRDVFRGSIHGVDSASQVQNVFMAIMDQALRVLCAEMFEWNASSIAQRVPPEVLASCLHFLPLPDLIRASHVSQHWRSVALAFPALWSDIRLTSVQPRVTQLLHLVLSRTGVSPIDFTYTRGWNGTGSPGPLSEISRILCGHMNHIRSIAWSGSIDAPCFSQPAPMLETISCSSAEVASLPDKFLTGSVGRLNFLELAYLDFPLGGCPALRSVTRLVCTLPWSVRPVAGLPRLFDFFPNIEHLHLRGLRWHHGVPSGPVPPSLEFLMIETQDMGVDLPAVLDGCRHEQVRHVILQPRTVDADMLISLVRSLNTLDVSRIYNIITLKGSTDAGFTRSIDLDFSLNLVYPPEFDSFIALHAVQIAGLKSLRLPLSAWTRLLSLSDALPDLTEVTLCVSQYEDYRRLATSPPIDQSPLHTPILRRIILEIPPCDDGQDLTAVPEIRTCQLLGPDSPSDVDVKLVEV